MLGTKILEERESKFNGHLRVVKTIGLGTYIQANGLTQSGGIVESIWKSTLKQINKLTNQPINSCLVLGLGGGTVAKLVQKFWPKAKIKGVDIDPVMIELGKKYLGLDKTDVNIEISDAESYVKYLMSNTKYDLVVVDLYQGDKFPKKFESEEFLKSLTRHRTVIFNRLSYKNNKAEADRFREILRKIFRNVETFHPVTNLMLICKI